MEELHEAVSVMTRNLSAFAQDGTPAGSPSLYPEQNPLSEMAAPDENPRSLSPDGDADAGGFVARAALRYMEEHCAEHLNLADVADHVYVSQWHLSKLINRYAQQSFFDLLNRYRVERSQAMLADPMFKVNEIAYAVGYADVAHFSRIFKKMTGKTPMEYRASLR
jgi:AraC-like DNA-binding protein